MAVAQPASIGRVNAAGSEDALFLKVFAGEVLTAFERSSVTQGAEMVRAISSGKSASFPVMGRIAAAYHTPGAEIVGTDVNHNEKVITINDLLISSAFLSNIEEAKNHWDVRGAYSAEIGRALAFQKDKHVQEYAKEGKEKAAKLKRLRKSRSINSLLEILKKEFKEVKVSYEKRDKLMPIRGTLSTKKAVKLIGYKSQWPIETGYLKYINWYKSFFKKI